MIEIIKGDTLEVLIRAHGGGGFSAPFDLIVTDPPYAFSGQGAKHEMTATVAVGLREAARFLKPGRWMLVMCASSWRSTAYMVDALRGVLEPVRIATWCKPQARTKVATSGWKWASVNVVAFRNGRAEHLPDTEYLDHFTAAPLIHGQRAQLPPEVADWMVKPFAVAGGTLLDPFAGSGEILRAAERAGMSGIGIEATPAAAAV